MEDTLGEVADRVAYGNQFLKASPRDELMEVAPGSQMVVKTLSQTGRPMTVAEIATEINKTNERTRLTISLAESILGALEDPSVGVVEEVSDGGEQNWRLSDQSGEVIREKEQAIVLIKRRAS